MTTTVRPETVQRTRAAKEPASPVAGPYGHPFHPLLVTVPIGAWVASLVFDIASKAKDDFGGRALTYGSEWLIGIGVIGAVLAALFGLMDLSRITGHTHAKRMALIHLTLNLCVVAAYVGNFIWRYDGYDTDREVKTGQLVLSIASLLVLAASGWIGGMLAYRYGVRVADEVTQAEAFEEERARR